MSGTRSDHVREVNVDDEPAPAEVPSRTVTDGLRRLRYEHPEPPVRMLTFRGASEHSVDGLAAGAEDSSAKPFSFSAERRTVGPAGYATGLAEEGR